MKQQGHVTVAPSRTQSHPVKPGKLGEAGGGA